MPKWISVSDDLPLKKRAKSRGNLTNGFYTYWETDRILCSCRQKSGKIIIKEGFCRIWDDGWVEWIIPGTIGEVTHWMPMPDPPSDID